MLLNFSCGFSLSRNNGTIIPIYTFIYKIWGLNNYRTHRQVANSMICMHKNLANIAYANTKRVYENSLTTTITEMAFLAKTEYSSISSAK